MTSTDPHGYFDELAAGHALYALEPEDEQVFLAHLAGCAACERAVTEHRETLAHLAYAAAPEEPPPALLEGIRAGVRASGRPSTYGPAPEEEPAAASSLDEAREKRSRRLQGPGLRRAATWLGAAAALALVASLGIWNTALQRDQEDSRDRLQAVLATLEGESSRTIPLKSPDGEVLAIAVVDGREMSLVVDRLAPNDADATSYVLWGRNAQGGVRAVGPFDVAAAYEVHEDMPLEDEMTAFMLTHEKGNEPPAVSTEPVMAVGEV